MIRNFDRVEQNIYRGGAPNPQDLQILAVTYKIKRVISLDVAVASQIAPFLKQHNIQQVTVALNASDTSITDPINYLVRNIVTLLQAVQPSFIHCQLGQDRTGFAVAIFRILHNHWSVEQALNEARKYGYGAGISMATQNLYKQLLTSLVGSASAPTTAKTTPAASGTVSSEDTGAVDDIVHKGREESTMRYTHPLSFNPQESFAPEVSLQYLAPDVSPITGPQDTGQQYSDREIKQTLRQQVLEEIKNNLPQVGEYANNGPIQGAGPVEVMVFHY